VSTYLELVREPALRELGRWSARALELVGPVKLDFKHDPAADRFHLFEVNPRFTLWCYLGTACGVNLPKIAYSELVGEQVEVQHAYKTGVRWLSFGNDLRAFVRDYRPRGELSLGEWLRSFRGRKIYDVFSWRDPLPLGVSVYNYSRSVLARLAAPLRPARSALDAGRA
jgi:predicted ATP-grasp superfamily ATP-dependent carboligase